MKVAFPIPWHQLVGMGSVIVLSSLQRVQWPRISCLEMDLSSGATLQPSSSARRFPAFPQLSSPCIYAEENLAGSSVVFI